MGWGFWYCAVLAAINAVRSLVAHQKDSEAQSHMQMAELWLAAAVVIGSLK